MSGFVESSRRYDDSQCLVTTAVELCISSASTNSGTRQSVGSARNDKNCCRNSFYGISGPHSVPMFEVNLFTVHQTGAFFSWLVVNRGPCSYVARSILSTDVADIIGFNSVLIHPNTGDAYRDHTELATWMGQPYPLFTDILRHGPR